MSDMSQMTNSSPASTTDRQIRVFISSTFRDMMRERDLLVKRVFPHLRRLCAKRLVTFTEVDLLWGITKEQAAEGKVLPLCLAEIERSRPYFIGLLGERYGWVPETIPAEIIEREPWLGEHLHGKTSVTELEIVHGVLRQGRMHGHAYFYFRDPSYMNAIPEGQRGDFMAEDAERGEKLQRLKQSLRSARDEGVCQLRENYADPEQLAEWILEDFTALIDQRWPPIFGPRNAEFKLGFQAPARTWVALCLPCISPQ
jgi:hypothetical protein